MNHVVDGGGGGGTGHYVVSRSTLTAVAHGLGTAATDLDSVGTSRPAAAGTGLAESLLLTVLATASDAAARLAFESTTLAAAVEDCNVDAETADSAAAADFLVGDG